MLWSLYSHDGERVDEADDEREDRDELQRDDGEDEEEDDEEVEFEDISCDNERAHPGTASDPQGLRGRGFVHFGRMITDTLEALIGTPRLARYRAAADDDAGALALYVWNSKMCAAYCEALSWVEVGLRNQLAHFMRDLHSRSGVEGSWWDTDEPWFDPWFEEPAIAQLIATREKLQRRDRLTHGHVVAELQFGFWVRLLAKRFEASLWTASLRRAFPAGVSRGQIERQFSRMNKWRNRAAHHECMLERDLDQDWEALQRAAQALDPELAEAIIRVADFPRIAAVRP